MRHLFPTPSRPRRLARLRRSTRAVAAIEFALAGPVFLVMAIGLFDFSYQVYLRTILTGAVEDAARSATLEDFSTNPTALDDRVVAAVQKAYQNPEITFTRTNYVTFSDVQQPERFTDANANGQYDAGECFEDYNTNGSWDRDRGRSGNGSSATVVLYTATLKFNPMLPLPSEMGDAGREIKVATTLRNQPWSTDPKDTTVRCA